MPPKAPVYTQISQQLQSKIANGIYAPGTFLPSERILCDELGISRMTLRKSLDELEASGYVVRQQGRGTLVVSSPLQKETPPAAPEAADGLCVVFILCAENGRDRFSETFHANLFYNIERQCTKLGYHLIYKTCNKDDLLDDILRGLNPSFLILSSFITQELLDQVEQKKVPAVIVNYQDDRFVSIQNDEAGGASQIVQYLIDQGHQRIGVLTGPRRYLTTEQRLAAWESTLRANGLSPDQMFIHFGDWEFECGMDAADRIAALAPDDRPDAVFAFNDKSAAGLIRGLAARGIAVPDDISVVGFDDMPICTEMSPQLTTVRVNLSAMAFAIVQQIWYAHHHLDSDFYPFNVIVSCQCICRDSVKKRGKRSMN